MTDGRRSIVLKVAQASNENEQRSPDRFEAERKISKDFQQQLKEMQPGIKLHPSIYPEESLEKELKVQTNSGLGPDLVIADSNQALNLVALGLTEPIQLTKERQNLINPAALERVKIASGSLAGQPVSQYLQLACFDKRKLKKSTNNPQGAVRGQWQRHDFWNGHQPPGSLLEPRQFRGWRGVSHFVSRQDSHCGGPCTTH